MRSHQAGVEAAILGQEGRQIVELRVYQALNPALGDIGQFGQGNGQEIQGQSQRLPMEVAAGYDLSFGGKDQGIVGGSIDFPLQNPLHPLEGITAGACTWGMQRSE